MCRQKASGASYSRLPEDDGAKSFTAENAELAKLNCFLFSFRKKSDSSAPSAVRCLYNWCWASEPLITVLLPSTLRVTDSDRIEVHEPVATIGELVESIDRRIPGFRDQLDDSVFNFAVNDEMLLHHARERALRDGDVVEVIPTISGG